MTFKALFFDFDGVLADTEKLHFEGFHSVLKKEGLDLDEKDYWQNYLGYDDRECFKTFYRNRNQTLNPEKLGQLIQTKTQYMQKYFQQKNTLLAGVKENIPQLAQNLPLAIVSGALRQEIELILNQNGLRQAFKLIIAPGDFTHSKPHPQPYELALKRLSTQMNQENNAQETLVIEDSPFGIEAGKSAGMVVWAVKTNYPAKDLTAADRLFDDTAALLASL